MDGGSQQQTQGQKAKVKIRLKGAGQESEASHAGSQLSAGASPSQQATAPSRVSIKIKQPNSRLGQAADAQNDGSDLGLPPAKRMRSTSEPSSAPGMSAGNGAAGYQDAIYVSDDDDVAPGPVKVKSEATASQHLKQQFSTASIKAESKPARSRLKPGAKVEKKEEKKPRVKPEGGFGLEGELEDHISDADEEYVVGQEEEEEPLDAGAIEDMDDEDEEMSEDDDYDDDEEEDERPRGRGSKGKGAKAGSAGKGTRTRAAGGKGGKGRGKGKSSTGTEQDTAYLEDLDADEGFMLGANSGVTDFTDLVLKPDHANRPLWTTPNGRVFLETFSPVYKQAQDFLIAIAEPVCRPEYVHEYQLTPHSLYAAVSVGLDTETIIGVLSRLSKVQLDSNLKSIIVSATKNYGKVKLVLKRNKFFVETSDPAVFDVLANDSVIRGARVGDEEIVEHALRERAVASLTRVTELDLDQPSDVANAGLPSRGLSTQLPAAAAATAGAVQAPGFFGNQPDGTSDGEGLREGGRLSIDDVEEGEDVGKVVKSFEIQGAMVETVKRRCLPGIGGLNYPMLEEYDFRGDRNTPDLNVELKPHVKLRPYQEKSLSKMFGNGRARSGIIVLPCGAGKSLVGVAAAARMRKSCLCLCTSSVSVDQWKHQFMLWTNLADHQVARFTSENKEMFAGDVGVMITTFTMIAFSGKRSEESEKVMEAIRSREWGLLLLDEVHVVPAQMFRKVIGIIAAHCKLGLTATLVREDSLIGDLNFLIGPKLYEANWLDLTRAGHIANVQCVEVWCPMTREFYREYLKPENSGRKGLLYVMNPNKFMACQFLINWHERERKDKVIVFSDNIWALREYATRLGKPFIYGPTGHAERTRVLHAFKNDPSINTIFLSKVGDNSLDIPEANVLIQISSHAGSRRQEAQRLGRILRAKRAKSGPATEFNAFFYTLVSQDTQEMYYSTKRQQFLIDQGYAFKVVTNLVDTAKEAMEGQLMYSRREEQLDLLCRVLTAGLDEAGVEVTVDKDAEDMASERGKRPGSKKIAGDIRALTGAAGLRYLEYRAEAGPAANFALPHQQAGGRGGPGGRGSGAKKGAATDAARKAQRALGLSKK